MNISSDYANGKKAAEILFSAFSNQGIFGRVDMPEDQLPSMMVRGSLEHILFITLTVAIDYQRDADKMWEASRKTFEDPETRYLYDPRSLHETPMKKIIEDMQRYRLSKKAKKDAFIWQTNGVTFFKKWKGDPRFFLEDCRWNATKILQRLYTGTHERSSRQVLDHPFLRGKKIGPLWVRMLRDNVGIQNITALDEVPIPVDVHVARSTLCLGVVRGEFEGRLEVLFESVREVWANSVVGLSMGNRPMIALDLDEPLWHLSRYGCSTGKAEDKDCPQKEGCPLPDLCCKGTFSINGDQVKLGV